MTESTHHAVSRTTVPQGDPRNRRVVWHFARARLASSGDSGDRRRAIVEPGEGGAVAAAPAMWMVLPFAAILGSIALLPLIPATQHWWDSNSKQVDGCRRSQSADVLIYYALMHHAPVVGHWPAHHVVPLVGAGAQTSFIRTVLENALLQEYVPFIVLLFSLYTISGGIRIEGDLTADPITNASFLAVGRGAGKSHRHDRRGDAADSAAAGNQSGAAARQTHGRDVYFRRLQLRRTAVAARRSAAVSGLFGRRAVSCGRCAFGPSGR